MSDRLTHAAVPESLIIIDGMNDTKPQRSANTDSARGATLPTSPGAHATQATGMENPSPGSRPETVKL